MILHNPYSPSHAYPSSTGRTIRFYRPDFADDLGTAVIDNGLGDITNPPVVPNPPYSPVVS